jgi:L-2-hydroxyglutarate oxidase LhgO
MFTSHEL